MKYLSVCSGIEAASVAWEPLGWEPLAFSEIEPFPRAVLQHHYPNTPLHGDFTELKDQPWIMDADLLCGGTPCQAFSVAGLRQSLADDRGNLTLQFVLLANAIDHLRSTAGREPAWILWENVPGVLSTSDNAFGAFLGGLCGRSAPIPEPEGGWTRAGVVDGPSRCAAWRTLDAQHFGVAQRRQRVFVLALGGAGRWAAADALLPLIESSRWHPAPRRGKGEGVAGGVADGAGSGSWWDGSDTAGTLTCNNAGGEQRMPDKDNFGAVLIRMREGKEGGGKGPLVSEDQSLTLATANDQVLAFTNRGIEGDRFETLRAQSHGALSMTAHGMQVRRLTPVECERLQGFPDGYTAIPWRGKPADQCPDGPRYKALGNSWAVPCARYIGERIKEVRP
jgi:DNA (cytosine-5)-methyltransferase 1